MALSAVNYVIADTTIELGFTTYLVDSSAGNITLTLPSIVADGINFIIKRFDTISNNNTVTLVPQLGELIDNITSKKINQNSSIVINSLNNAWYTVSGNQTGNEINLAFNQIRGTQSIRPYVLINNSVNTSLGYFSYNGTSYYGSNPVKLEITYSIDSDPTENVDFTVRLFDITNKTIIGTVGPVTQTGNSVLFYKESIYTFSNLPTNESTIEINGRLNSGTIGVRLHSVRLILN